MITTNQNKQIKQILKLKKNARERKKEKMFIVEGIRMFREIPEDQFVKAYVTEDFFGEHNELFQQKDTEIVSDSVMKEISDTMTPQGVLALVKMKEYSLDEFLGKHPLLLVLENIQDPGNLGTILRTGEGAGITGLIMSKDTVDIYNPKVIRSTMGSIFRVPFCYVEEMADAVDFLKKNDITTYAAHLDGATYTKENFKGASAFFIGNEGNGLTRQLTEKADKMIKIPMMGKVESLNAAMASGLLVYEARRQRGEGGE
ncbi:TrmH family RNA methyltransferase [Anaerostipes faecalis]|uniref:TrmH family RNA methyltransferase n=1 Tax=Anaerostipes faecalis TaxID=2738446 RepID=UPI001C1DD9DC|nr:RNA methyltransferase [Anaerostipes faecalis]